MLTISCWDDRTFGLHRFLGLQEIQCPHAANLSSQSTDSDDSQRCGLRPRGRESLGSLQKGTTCQCHSQNNSHSAASLIQPARNGSVFYSQETHNIKQKNLLYKKMFFTSKNIAPSPSLSCRTNPSPKRPQIDPILIDPAFEATDDLSRAPGWKRPRTFCFLFLTLYIYIYLFGVLEAHFLCFYLALQEPVNVSFLENMVF